MRVSRWMLVGDFCGGIMQIGSEARVTPGWRHDYCEVLRYCLFSGTVVSYLKQTLIVLTYETYGTV